MCKTTKHQILMIYVYHFDQMLKDYLLVDRMSANKSCVGIFLYLEAFECNTTSEWLNHIV